MYCHRGNILKPKGWIGRKDHTKAREADANSVYPCLSSRAHGGIA